MIRSTFLFAALSAAALSAAPARAECAKSPTGAPMATGEGKGSSDAKNAAVRRVKAERAAYLDALTKLRACLGEEGVAKVTGLGVVETRYFDSDPIVEVDVAALTGEQPKVVLLASAPPKTDAGSVNKIRLATTRAAVTLAQRGAAEALDAFVPAAEKTGTVRASLEGVLGGCQEKEVAFWDDGAVSVTVECSKGEKGDVVKKGQPEVKARDAKDAKDAKK